MVPAVGLRIPAIIRSVVEEKDRGVKRSRDGATDGKKVKEKKVKDDKDKEKDKEKEKDKDKERVQDSKDDLTVYGPVAPMASSANKDKRKGISPHAIDDANFLFFNLPL